MPFVCIFTVVKVVLESPPLHRGTRQTPPEPPRASWSIKISTLHAFVRYILCCGRHRVCIVTTYSMLRQASCMHFYDMFYVAAGILYAFLRYILCCGRYFVCIFTIYSMLQQAPSMHIYDIVVIKERDTYFLRIFAKYYATTIFSSFPWYVVWKWRFRYVAAGVCMHFYDILYASNVILLV